MIKVTITNNQISVIGHAEYAPHGQDIVCAAVSALLQTFIMSVEELTDDKIICDISAGNAVIKYKELSKQSKLLVSSFLIGIQAISAGYPQYVKYSPSLEDIKSKGKHKQEKF